MEVTVMDHDRKIDKVDQEIERELLEMLENPTSYTEKEDIAKEQTKTQKSFDWFIIILLSIIIIVNVTIFTIKMFQ